MSPGPRRGRGGGRGVGRGGLASGRRPVSEVNRISFVERLEKFRTDSDQVLTFEADLSNHDRAVIHEHCRKMGLKSKSSGKGDQRRLSVFKTRLCKEEDQSSATSLQFSAETRRAMNELFSQFPPTQEELAGNIDEMPEVDGSSLKDDKEILADSSDFRRPVMGKSEVSKQVAKLAARLKKMPGLQQITEERAKLPIASFKDEITSAVEKNQVLLIAGETGCGKTTQVPQFIVDHMWSQGKPCKVLCTQPRRISAITVAERIAAERGETIGETVGYQIRLESRGGRHSSMMFCTNGILLRKLVSSRIYEKRGTEIAGFDATHIIVDEIHERDRNADLILIVLRDILQFRPDLRLILMSATLNADLFSKYFNDCPTIRVPGFIYPVCSYYLEDVLAITESGKEKPGKDTLKRRDILLNEEDKAAMDDAISQAWLEDEFDLLMEMVTENTAPEICNYQHSLTGATALMVAAGKGRVDDITILLSLGADFSRVSNDGNSALDWANRYGHAEVTELLQNHSEKKRQLLSANDEAEAILVERYLSSIDQEEVDVALIERLLSSICASSSYGNNSAENEAILVFLPGWEDITRVKERLQASPLFGDSSKFLLLPLHSMVPSSEQKRVFQRPRPGVRKIVLSTNIAETAVTIDDIVFVIDSGRMKEKSYDPYSKMSTFQMVWVSKASARQREGRAGRCQPGVCYHLFSKVRAAALAEFQIPEINRTPLEELCLQVKLLDPHCKIKEFLGRAVDPPLELAIHNAIVLLQDIGALSFDEKLTELGRQLGSLPVHPVTSKMLLFAIFLNCLDPALTIACAAGYRDPFILPMAPQLKKRAFAVRMEFAGVYGGYSDHLAIVTVYERWEEAKSKGEESRFCSQNFLSSATMATLAGMRQQLQNELAQKGFIPKESHACSLNAHDQGIVRAVVAAGLYPMVGTLLPPLPSGQKAIVKTARGEKVRIHPHSANFRMVHFNEERKETIHQPLLVFDEITRGESWVYIRNSTLVKPYVLLLLATEVVVAPLESQDDDDDDDDDDDTTDDGDDNNDDDDDAANTGRLVEKQDDLMSSPEKHVAVVVDRWLKFEATAVEAAQIHCLRERLAAAIAFKIKHPRQLLPVELGATIYTIACLLSFDGSLDAPPLRVHDEFHAPRSSNKINRGNKQAGLRRERSKRSSMENGSVPALNTGQSSRNDSTWQSNARGQFATHRDVAILGPDIEKNGFARYSQSIARHQFLPVRDVRFLDHRNKHVLPESNLLGQEVFRQYGNGVPNFDRDIYYKRHRWS